MRILIMGVGKMGTWLADELCLNHEVGVFDKSAERLKYVFNCQRFTSMDEIGPFAPEILINAVNLRSTKAAFREVLPLLPRGCILADIASVKNSLRKFYLNSPFPFVSTHPMFGPTFVRFSELQTQNAIIIKESAEKGKIFFYELFNKLGLKIHEYSFAEHDATIAYSLAVPFASTLVFASCMKKQRAPGTTFQKHLHLARGLLSEDHYLLTEILLSPHAADQISEIKESLGGLLELLRNCDSDGLLAYLQAARHNIDLQTLTGA